MFVFIEESDAQIAAFKSQHEAKVARLEQEVTRLEREVTEQRIEGQQQRPPIRQIQQVCLIYCM
jgi:chromosome condensin MukBEF ATPase and DNA-binding subunit MukB